MNEKNIFNHEEEEWSVCEKILLNDGRYDTNCLL